MGAQACEDRKARAQHGDAEKSMREQEEGTFLGVKDGKPGMVVHFCNSRLDRLKQEGREFKESLDYKRVGSSSGYKDPAAEESLK